MKKKASKRRSPAGPTRPAPEVSQLLPLYDIGGRSYFGYRMVLAAKLFDRAISKLLSAHSGRIRDDGIEGPAGELATGLKEITQVPLNARDFERCRALLCDFESFRIEFVAHERNPHVRKCKCGHAMDREQKLTVTTCGIEDAKAARRRSVAPLSAKLGYHPLR